MYMLGLCVYVGLAGERNRRKVGAAEGFILHHTRISWMRGLVGKLGPYSDIGYFGHQIYKNRIYRAISLLFTHTLRF